MFGGERAGSPACRLCIALGLCSPGDTSARFSGTLTHRIWTCPALSDFRKKHLPEQLHSQVLDLLDDTGQLPGHRIHEFTRALVPSPALDLPREPDDELFRWVVTPPSMPSTDVVAHFADGSRLDGHWKCAGLCARHGWAFALQDYAGRTVAAACGRPPWWSRGIFGAELWGLLQAAMHSFDAAPFLVDCLAVQKCSTQTGDWARAPERPFARTLAPLLAALEGRPVTWMPAHRSEDDCRHHVKSDGAPLRRLEVKGNDLVDGLAKAAASLHRLPDDIVKAVQDCWDRTLELALWIGRVTAAANHFELPHRDARGNRQYIRDADTSRLWQPRRAVTPAERPCPQAPVPPAAPPADAPPALQLRIGRRVHLRRALARDDLHLLRAIHDRAADRRPQEIPAAERMADLRRRVRSRNQL